MQVDFVNEPGGARSYSLAELKLALAEKREGDTLFQTMVRLEREGKIKHPQTVKEEGLRPVRASVVEQMLHDRDLMVAEGTVREIDRLVRVIVEIAAGSAKANHRKTVKPEDVTGDSLSRWRKGDAGPKKV